MNDLKRYIRDIPDFPQPGILFRDITPLLNEPRAFTAVIDALAERVSHLDVKRVSAVESRGFIFGAPLAMRLEAGFVPMRKPGKLPYRTIGEEYSLEYGTDVVEMHTDAVMPGENVLVLDDLLATGGTAAAMCRLVERARGTIVACAFVIELTPLNGRAKLPGREVISLIAY